MRGHLVPIPPADRSGIGTISARAAIWFQFLLQIALELEPFRHARPFGSNFLLQIAPELEPFRRMRSFGSNFPFKISLELVRF